MRYTILLIVVCPFLFAADAPPAGPRSPQAVAALAKLDGAKKKALDEYQSAIRQASVTALQELDAAKTVAMKQGANLAEANAIEAKINEIKSPMVQGVAGTSWLHTASKGIIRLEPSGAATCTVWKTPGRWSESADGKVTIEEPGNATVEFTLTRDMQYAVYSYHDGRSPVLAVRKN